ncbi:hypothetical protein Tcan_01890 [Toxocara canis]|uniref:Uncharacterized protein n=1 Tax=Toxocara canis TaxID=6265 RepID=A0A0B2VB68_TOXCA|nr:hypothetical protein Tcan_01890 [Toxocara canis]
MEKGVTELSAHDSWVNLLFGCGDASFACVRIRTVLLYITSNDERAVKIIEGRCCGVLLNSRLQKVGRRMDRLVGVNL